MNLFNIMFSWSKESPAVRIAGLGLFALFLIFMSVFFPNTINEQNSIINFIVNYISYPAMIMMHIVTWSSALYIFSKMKKIEQMAKSRMFHNSRSEINQSLVCSALFFICSTLLFLFPDNLMLPAAFFHASIIYMFLFLFLIMEDILNCVFIVKGFLNQFQNREN